ncbi:MAG: phosphate transport system regulatory protein PhoU [Elusimicrobia bacterium RIFOXYA2_FULL_50_26]|nr:MAG: phosphate transport system regulatory protein PhoU [Elusimicrobia bacterium RIFOXYA2_FULL_50_26]OGS23127.1 MAG: phosphate transport system regulatory protein PhoU [Elusimicrobia bacterium RIFOXYB2_FULL_50_12]
MLQEKLVHLQKKLAEYAALVERMVDKSISGLLNGDSALLESVINTEEPAANAFEIDLDEMCTTLIAQYQPAARDLRTVLMVLRMNNDLERMGDHAVNIAQSAIFLSARPPVKPLEDIPAMSRVAVRMFKDGVDSFINRDAVLARTVCERDAVVDDFQTKILTELTAIMQKDPSTIERSLQLIRITANLERIADLSTNICEDVLFMVHGRVIKHHKEEQ